MTKEEFTERKKNLPPSVVSWVEGWHQQTPWQHLETFCLNFGYQAEVPEILPCLVAELVRRKYVDVEVKGFCWWGSEQRHVAVIFCLNA